MFDDMIEKDEKVGPDHPIYKQDGVKKGVVTPGSYTPSNIFPCNVTDCKYYSRWTVDHSNNASTGAGSITIDKGWNPMWCMACEDFEGITIMRKK